MIEEIIQVLKTNKTILYPTDTVWGIGCDAASKVAVENVYNLKKRDESKALIVLVSSLNMLKKYVSISKFVENIINSTNRSTTIIYNNPCNIAENLINKSDNSIAIRIVSNGFCHDLIEEYGKAIVSTSANISGSATPQSYDEIENDIISNVDYIVDLEKDKICKKSSKIIKIVDDKIIVLRE